MFLYRKVCDRCLFNCGHDTTEIHNTRINVWLRPELKESQALNLHLSGPGLSLVSLISLRPYFVAQTEPKILCLALQNI